MPRQFDSVRNEKLEAMRAKQKPVTPSIKFVPAAAPVTYDPQKTVQREHETSYWKQS